MSARKRNIQVPPAERGYALIMSLFVMVTLFGMGFVVMNNTSSDLKEAGAVRSHASASSIAEAGIAWGIDYMSRNWDFESTGNFNGPLGTFRPMSDLGSDTMCGAGFEDEPENCYPESIRDWLRVVPSAGGSIDPSLVPPEEVNFSEAEPAMSFGGGSYRVAIRDDDDGDGDLSIDSNGIILIRSYAVTLSGTRVMLEVAVGEGCRE